MWPETVILVAVHVASVIGLFWDIFTSNTTSGDLRITLSQEETLGTRSRVSDLLMPARQSLGSPSAFVTVILFEPAHFYNKPDSRHCQTVLSIYFFLVIFPTSAKGKWRLPCGMFVGNTHKYDRLASSGLCFSAPCGVDWQIYVLEQHLINLQPWPSHIIG